MDLGYKLDNALVLGRIYVFNRNVSIGSNVHLYPNVTFMGDGIISIGNGAKIGNNTVIVASREGGVTIGENTIVAANCYIVDSNHGTAKDLLISRQEVSAAMVSIGNDVWIANGVSVIKGAKIEDGAVIGAKSLVNSKIGMNKICWGIPAREIKERS